MCKLPQYERVCYKGEYIKMFRKTLFLILSMLVLAGFSGHALEFTARFDEIDGLRKNNPVFFDTKRIGSVTKVEYTDTATYLVQIAVEKQFSSLPKDSSTYYIDTSPENYDRKAIRIVQIHKGGQVLKPDAVVDGQSKYAVVFDQITNKFRKNIGVLESEISELFKDLQKLSEDEQIKQLENQLENILGDVENLSTKMKKKLQTEILPRIKEQLENIKSRLERDGREEKLNDAEEKFDTVSEKFMLLFSS